MKPLQDGLSVIEALFILIVICLIGFIAWHEWEIHHKKLITTQSSFVNLPRGNLNDTYIYDKKVFPNLANDYSLIYRSDASPRAVEVDYISNKTLSTIHSDMVSICKERGFKFQPPASDLSIECSDRSNAWKFNVMDGALLSEQKWFPEIAAQKSIDLKNTDWLQIISSGPPVFN